ncbi:YidC/Oxa1 family membrane protein insertase [Flintibacter sp. NSJ-23]|uniref:YidC/Oxa1 family membrane protein insertase n=1 Tax=Flintibacter hominis TaxID=2763048 RepID=A0A8J6M7L6_9FIRM|nr:YidC/Oxa1 family membrane protein insertase [Flintibacter hominis]
MVGIILKPFAWLLLTFYNIFNSYGLALILFAIVIKLILFPVSLKSKKSMIQMNLLSGKMQQLQKQYGKDRERYNLEVQKLYEREKVNPMGGCLWSLIPMIVLIALYGIIREPITYFMNLSMDQIKEVAQLLNWDTVAVTQGWVTQAMMDKAGGVFENGAYNQLYLLSLINDSNLASLQAALGEAGSGLFVMNFQFLGLDLSLIPTWKFWTGGLKWSSIGLFLLPLVSTGVSFLSMKVSMATNKMNTKTQNAQMDQTNKIMMWMMPLMSLWIGFTVPAGLSVYWVAQYFVTMAQEVICGRMLKKDYEAARLAAEERERQEKEEEKRRKEEARLERARRIEEEKQNKGKKKSGQKKKKDEEPDQEGVNKEDSREGIRAYARGRAYIPGRFGGVTPYQDPNILIRAQMEAQAAAKGKKKGQPAPESQAEQPAAPVQTEQPAAEAPAQEELDVQSAQAVEEHMPSAAEVTEEAETQEIEVEVEEIEVEVPDEDEKKEGI